MDPSPRLGLQEAFLLHRRKYRETSLIIEVFAAEFGRFGLLAKGAMRGGVKTAGLLQPFQPLGIAWAGRGELPVLSRVEALGGRLDLPGVALVCGLYLNELLVRLLPQQDPLPDVFVLYRQTLQALSQGMPVEETLRGFEIALLEGLGYGLTLDYDAASGAAVRPEAYYRYRVEHGPEECDAESGEIRGSALLALRDRRFAEPGEARAAKRLMRRVIQHYLGGRPLQTRALFKYQAGPR